MRSRRSRAGFTLIEMILFVAIFALAMGAFMGVFTNIASVAIRQSGAAEVQSQSQFILQTIQYYVERSSLVELTPDTATSTLTLRMSSSTEDPVVISLNGSGIQLKAGAAAAQTITSNKVNISNLIFTNRRNAGGRDSVAVSFTVAYNTNNPTQQFGLSLQGAVARVSAATFDSNIVPPAGSAGNWALGAAAGDWRSINNTIFFSGSNVGISSATFTPLSRLHVQGDVRVEGGDVYVYSGGSGLILKSGSGTCFRLTVTAGGGLATSSITCP